MSITLSPENKVTCSYTFKHHGYVKADMYVKVEMYAISL